MELFSFEALSKLIKDQNLRELRSRLEQMNTVDIAQFMAELDPEDLLIVFRILPKALSAEVFSYLDQDARGNIVNAVSDSELCSLVERLFVDDAVDFLDEVPANVVHRVMKATKPETRDIINRFLQYPENSAGSLMTIELVEFKKDITAGQAIDIIRKTGPDKETIYTCYVIDDGRKLLGIVPLRKLLLAPENAKVSDIMDGTERIVSVNTQDDQELVAEIARKYDLLAVPVVDNEDRLVGIITIDDIVDVIEDENTEDLEKMALMTPSETDYLHTGVLTMARNRIVWLLILMVSATFTGQIIANFENVLSVIVGLTACIPMLMDTGGNAGSQSSTMVIRGLALGNITPKDFFKVVYKEVRVGILCGFMLAAVNFVRMLILGTTDTALILIVCAAMTCSVIVSKTIGCILPIAAKAVKLDPALMAGPMLTTIVDALTLLIYFGLASAFLI